MYNNIAINKTDEKHTKNAIPTINKNITNDELSFNKKQFWTYKRLHGGTLKRSGKTKKTTHKLQNKEDNNGIIKEKKEKPTKKIFHLVNNKIATDKDLVNRLNSIYIPPAYKDVVVAKSANNKIQAIGTDKRGRRQYIYNTNYTKKRNDRKFEDIMELGKKISKIETDNHNMLKMLHSKTTFDWNLPDDYIPIIVYMLRTYNFRIGNEKYAMENKSYGITTLRNEHVKWDARNKNKFTIEFIGKKGILNRFTDDNPIIAELLVKLIENSKKKGHDGYLFKYEIDDTIHFITPEHIQSFFQEKYNSYITPKMFRTWYGNFHMLACLRKMFLENKLKPRLKKYEKHEIVKGCSEFVSSKLNNTPTVSKQSYIDNKILELVMRNPYRLAGLIPDDTEGQHQFLYKIIIKLRHS